MRNCLDMQNLRLAVVAYPALGEAAGSNMVKLLEVLKPLFSSIYLFTGGICPEYANVRVVNLPWGARMGGILTGVVRIAVVQLIICFYMVVYARRYDTVLFFIGVRFYILPMVTAIILSKKTVMLAIGTHHGIVKEAMGGKWYGLGSIIAATVGVMERLNYRLCDGIITESAGIAGIYGIGHLSHKILSPGSLPVDTDSLDLRREFSDRDVIVGYVGRLVRLKGVMNFIRAIPFILAECKDVRFLIGGEGELFPAVKSEIEKAGLSEKVCLTGWIPREMYCDILNSLKLFILPSFSEGLPLSLLEAMACGTPVVATPVGGVTDVIRDGENGFVMENNSPHAISRHVLRALSYPNLADVGQNAREYVKRNFSYDATVERYRYFFAHLNRAGSG